MQPLFMFPNPLHSSRGEVTKVALVELAGMVVLHVVVQGIKGLEMMTTLVTRKKWFAFSMKLLVFFQRFFGHH